MKRILAIFSIPFLMLSLAFSNNIIAAPYIGASLGISKVGDFCDDVSGIPGVTCEDSDAAFKLLGGMKINKNFAVEGSYNDFGEATIKGSGGTFTAEATGFNFSAIGIIPASKSVDFFGKVGMLFWDLKLAVSGTVNDSISETGNDVAFGFGANINIRENFALRIEFEKFQSIGKESTSTGQFKAALFLRKKPQKRSTLNCP